MYQIFNLSSLLTTALISGKDIKNRNLIRFQC